MEGVPSCSGDNTLAYTNVASEDTRKMTDKRLTKKDILQMAPNGIIVERVREAVKELQHKNHKTSYYGLKKTKMINSFINDLFGEVME